MSTTDQCALGGQLKEEAVWPGCSWERGPSHFPAISLKGQHSPTWSLWLRAWGGHPSWQIGGLAAQTCWVLHALFTLWFWVSILLGQERQKLLTRLEIGKCKWNKGFPQGSLGMQPPWLNHTVPRTLSAQGPGSRAGWNGSPSVSWTRQAALGVMSEGGNSGSLLMCNAKPVNWRVYYLYVEQRAKVWTVFLNLIGRLLWFRVDTLSRLHGKGWFYLKTL